MSAASPLINPVLASVVGLLVISAVVVVVVVAVAKYCFRRRRRSKVTRFGQSTESMSESMKHLHFVLQPTAGIKHKKILC